MSNKIPFGIYIGTPNGNDASAEAAFSNTYNSITSTVGQTSNVYGCVYRLLRQLGEHGRERGMGCVVAGPVTRCQATPVVAVGLGTKWDNGAGTLQQIAAGAHDDTYRAIVQGYKDAGYNTIDMRIGWEMNGNYMPWSMGNTADSVSLWRAAFAHVADVVHSVSGIKVNTVWIPTPQTTTKSMSPQAMLVMTK